MTGSATQQLKPRILIDGSSDLERRSHALAEYLSDLHRSLELGLEQELQPVRLMVLSETDWRMHSPYPYGFTFFRRLKDGTGLIFAPVDYPPNLLWVFRALILNNQQKPTSSLEMFLDLTLGHELGHAIADQIGLRTRVRWLDEFLATYLYLAALQNTNPDAFVAALEWGQILSGTNLECGLANIALLKPSGSRSRTAKRRTRQATDATVPRHDLGAFEYPLVRLPLANQAWYQARFTLFAAQLLEQHGFAFIHAALAVLPQAKGRGAIAKALVRLEPSFKPWFASFGS